MKQVMWYGLVAILALNTNLQVQGKPVTSGQDSAVDVKVDWPSFIAQQDPTWDVLPTHFDTGAFLGNGLLGATIYKEGNNRLRWEMGRADVTEHRRDNSRLPIGGLVLETVGKIQSGSMRLDLYNAEVRGEIKTDKGEIKFLSWIHTQEMVLITDVAGTKGERGAKFSWEATPCVEYVCAKAFPKDPPNPSSRMTTIDGIPVCVQDRFAGGQFATAWKEQSLSGKRRMILSIADSFPEKSAAQEAVQTVKRNATADHEQLVKSHRDWWHNFYPQSFVSVPDGKIQSFYWIQWYKLACASRPGTLPTDLLGPWFRKTAWPRIWWDLNIQTLYLPTYTGNRLMLGESLIGFFDAKRDNFYRNAKEKWGDDFAMAKAEHYYSGPERRPWNTEEEWGEDFGDFAYVTVTSDNQGLRGDGVRAPDTPTRFYHTSPGHLTWALHNYYLHYRYSMEHALVTEQKTHAFYPLLRASVNTFLRLLEKGDDGKLHLPHLMSPETKSDIDTNYNLALLRWGCKTLLELNRRYNLQDRLISRWEETLRDLTPYPVDETGFKLGRNWALEKSHRHWSHIQMVHPLHIMNLQSTEDQELLKKSINHWLTVDNSRQVHGWSHAAASSLHSTLGEGNKSLDRIQSCITSRFVRPNTMYIEGSPVIECSIIVNNSVQEMLLQSYNGLINVFPAMPEAWRETVFHNLRTEGAFLISAERKEGKTQWVRIQSLAGEPCRIKPNLTGDVKAQNLKTHQSVALKSLGNGMYEIDLAKNDEILLYSGKTAPEPVIRQLDADAHESNFWGVKAEIKK